jgi:hypothetical protein
MKIGVMIVKVIQFGGIAKFATKNICYPNFARAARYAEKLNWRKFEQVSYFIDF